MNNELYHFGVPRRSGRYPWGSGDRPYQGDGDAARPTTKQVNASRKSDRKNVKSLTDEEIQQRIDRINLEKRYVKAINEDLEPGKTEVKRILSDSGKKVLGAVATGAALYVIKTAVEAKAGQKMSGNNGPGDFKKAFKEAFNPKDFGNSIFNGGPKKK